MLINPWMIASLVFAGIGLLVELDTPKKKAVKEKPAVEKPAPSSVSVTVNAEGTKVKSESKKAVAKPPVKVLDEPSGDG